jgi:DNA-binding NarL/FixJ family response regulator
LKATRAEDLVGILEAAYAADSSDEGWLARVVESARPTIDEGLGVAGFFYDFRQAADVRVWSPVLVGTPPGALEALVAINQLAPADVARSLYRETPSCATLSERLGFGPAVVDVPLHRELLAPLGVMDFLSIAATDPDGVGCLVGAPLPRVVSVRRREGALWSRIAAHLAAGVRLRRRSAAALAGDASVGAEAILSPKGDVAHAEAPAQSADALDALKAATRQIDRARGRLRRTDPEGAIEAWGALVSGRWSLVDHFDHDGRRYVVAKKNDPDVGASRASLTRREQQTLAYAAMGHSNKLIAYELGLATSTVAVHLSSAAKKLGVSSRVTLIEVYRAIARR